jgi:hypothetical protein
MYSKKKKKKKKKKSKAIPATEALEPYGGCETSRIPHFQGNRLTDGGEVVSHMCQQHFTLQEDSWYSFLLKAESNLGP